MKKNLKYFNYSSLFAIGSVLLSLIFYLSLYFLRKSNNITTILTITQYQQIFSVLLSVGFIVTTILGLYGFSNDNIKFKKVLYYFLIIEFIVYALYLSSSLVKTESVSNVLTIISTAVGYLVVPLYFIIAGLFSRTYEDKVLIKLLVVLFVLTIMYVALALFNVMGFVFFVIRIIWYLFTMAFYMVFYIFIAKVNTKIEE